MFLKTISLITAALDTGFFRWCYRWVRTTGAWASAVYQSHTTEVLESVAQWPVLEAVVNVLRLDVGLVWSHAGAVAARPLAHLPVLPAFGLGPLGTVEVSVRTLDSGGWGHPFAQTA